MTEIESLSDFDEIWYIGVSEGADFISKIASILSWNLFLGV